VLVAILLGPQLIGRRRPSERWPALIEAWKPGFEREPTRESSALLAEKAGVHRNSVMRAEVKTTHGYAFMRIVQTLEAAGVEFTKGEHPGVRLRDGAVPNKA